MTFPKIGNVAPQFSLQDQDGKTVSLKQFKGTHTVVVYFYPKAMTPGCTVQACGLLDAARLPINGETLLGGHLGPSDTEFCSEICAINFGNL